MDGLGWLVGGYLAYVALAVGAALFLALVVALVSGRRRLRRIEERLALTEQRAETPLPPPVASGDRVAAEDEDDEEALVPTPLGPPDDAEPPATVERIDREMFWDLVLRESVVRAAAIGHGVRAVLDPRTRNRIRFEVRQEIKRARKQRRSEERAAVRQLREDRLEDSA